MPDLAGVVLAAGAGTRLAPLTRLRPKALCPIGNRALVDHALDRLATVADLGGTAVNLHHGADQVLAHLERWPGVHTSPEFPEALGTAGAIGALRGWIGDRDVVVTNADAWFGSDVDLASFSAGWDRERVRLLCQRTDHPSDFGSMRYCGVALLPARLVHTLGAQPSGLYEAMWRQEDHAGRLDLVSHHGRFVDCGTPADYLRANLSSSEGASVVDPDARIGAGSVVERSVVWDHSVVHPGEVLIDAVRAGPLTVLVR